MWTTSPPTEPGYCWQRVDCQDNEPLIMRHEGEGVFYEIGSDSPLSITDLPGEWQPVAPPIEQVILPSNGTRDYICGQIAQGIKNSGLPREQVEIVLRNLYAAFDLFWPMAD